MYSAKLCFNSIKVRLKHNKEFIRKAHEIRFQFHKGAIKTKRGESEPDRYLCFNSIKVRLKHSRGVSFRMRKLFQFHKGAIKTIDLCEVFPCDSVSIP